MTHIMAYPAKPSNLSINEEIVKNLKSVGIDADRDSADTPYAHISGNKVYFTTFTSRGIISICAVSPNLFNTLYASNKM